MPENLSDKVKEYLSPLQGKIVDIKDVRNDLSIRPGSNAWDGLRLVFFRLTQERIVKPSGKKDGLYKVLKLVQSVPVFSIKRERRPPFDLKFPFDYDTHMEMEFAEKIVIREGDLIVIAGMSNFGKTALALNFCGENIDSHPVLMGNEYTTIDDEPTPRFLNRLDKMDWVEWVNGTGEDKFTLLPVREDYAENVVKDHINLIDWINLDEHYMISKISEDIKRAIGRGIGIIVIQKAEGTNYGRGGQFTKDFADVELLIDKFTESESLLTIGKIKEYTSPVIGKTYAFGISQGIKIINFREVIKCPDCHGSKYVKSIKCERCLGTGKVDK
jgi:hypothetical protein